MLENISHKTLSMQVNIILGMYETLPLKKP